MASFIYFETTDEIFRHFDNYEIWPCAIVEKTNSGNIVYEICSFEDSDIDTWCLYGHLYTGGLECISDHKTLEDAKEFMKTLPKMPLTPLIYF